MREEAIWWNRWRMQTENKHKEEDERRRKVDETYRNKIAEELQKQREGNWPLPHHRWVGRTNKRNRPRRASHRHHSNREVRRLASWCIPQQNWEESEGYAGDEEGCYRELYGHIWHWGPIWATADRLSTTCLRGDIYLLRTESCTSLCHRRVRVFEKMR